VSAWAIVAVTLYATGVAFCGCMLCMSIADPDDRVGFIDWLTVIFWPLVFGFSVVTFIISELNMKNLLYHPAFIIAIGFATFAVALIDSSRVTWDCNFNCLGIAGKISVCLFLLCLAWLFLSNLFKTKK
jgi:hypothetical protein